jgi:hypothetical protein
MDLVDRWGATFNAANIPLSNTAPGWACMGRTFGVFGAVYMVLQNREGYFGTTNGYTISYHMGVQTGGGGTTAPTFSTNLGQVGMYNNNVAPTYSDNFTNSRRWYGGVADTGMVWAVETIAVTASEVVNSTIFAPTYGYKTIDPYPFFARSQANGFSCGGGFGNSLWTLGNGNGQSIFYNGVAAYCRLVPPTENKLADAIDGSFSDYPAFVEVWDSQNLNTGKRHSRGYIPDMALITGTASASNSTLRPAANGTAITEGGIQKYVMWDYVILPYDLAI